MTDWRRVDPSSGEPMSVWFTLRLDGAIELRNLRIASKGLEASRHTWFVLDDTQGTCMVGDKPLRRRQSGATGPNLDDLVCCAIGDVVEAHYDKVRGYTEGRYDAEPVVQRCSPAHWEQKTVSVPIDSLAVTVRRYHDNDPVRAFLRLGYHLALRDQPIFQNGQFIEQPLILDAGLRNLVTLRLEGFEELYAEVRRPWPSGEYLIELPGYQDPPPPITLI